MLKMQITEWVSVLALMKTEYNPRPLGRILKSMDSPTDETICHRHIVCLAFDEAVLSNPSSNVKKCRYPFGYLHFLKTDPNFNTNAPPFEARGCKVILGGHFTPKGVQISYCK